MFLLFRNVKIGRVAYNISQNLYKIPEKEFILSKAASIQPAVVLNTELFHGLCAVLKLVKIKKAGQRSLSTTSILI